MMREMGKTTTTSLGDGPEASVRAYQFHGFYGNERGYAVRRSVE